MLKVKNILAGMSTDVKINGLVGLESYLQSLLEGIEMRVFINAIQQSATIFQMVFRQVLFTVCYTKHHF